MQRRYVLRAFVLLALASFYMVLTQKYRAYDIDNPWFLSFSYNACHGAEQTDQFEYFHFPLGMDGVHLFGKLAAGTQCVVMNRLGWNPMSVVELNVAVGTISLALLWSCLSKYGYRETWIAAFVLLLGVTEPVVSMMEKARYEFFAFFLLCLALWLGVQGFELIAALVAFIAVETEPAAIIVPTAIMLLLASRTKNGRLLTFKCILAMMTALVFYVAMHPGAIREILAARSFPKFPIGGTLRAYFIDRRRHLAEALVILVGMRLLRSHRQELPDSGSVWLAGATSFILILLHPTVAYVVFAMPFLLLPTLEGYERAKRWRWIPVGLFLFLLAGYAYLYRFNVHEGFGGEEFSLVRQKIDESAATLHISDDRLRLAGDYTLWFAHPQHFSALASLQSLQHEDLFLCFDVPLQKGGLSALTSMWCPELKRLVWTREVSSIKLKGHLLHILVPTR